MVGVYSVNWRLNLKQYPYFCAGIDSQWTVKTDFLLRFNWIKLFNRLKTKGLYL